MIFSNIKDHTHTTPHTDTRGRTPALVEIDTRPYVAKGTKDDLMHHHKIFADRLMKISRQCDRSIARGKETKAREDALSALRKWLDDAKHFYSRYHPARFEATYMAAIHAFKLCRIESGAILFVSVTKSWHPCIHPFGHGVESMCLLFENCHNISWVNRTIFRKQSDVPRLVICCCERMRKVRDFVDGVTERNSVLLSLMELL